MVTPSVVPSVKLSLTQHMLTDIEFDTWRYRWRSYWCREVSFAIAQCINALTLSIETIVIYYQMEIYVMN